MTFFSNRRVVLAGIAAALALGALARPDSVEAAPKQHCTLMPSGPATFTSDDDPDHVVVMARWSVQVSCEQSSPLEGSTVELRMHLMVRLGDNGGAIGQTQVMLIYSGESGALNEIRFRGGAKGSWATFPGGIVGVDLDAQARSQGGAQLRGRVMFEGDTATHEVISFTPGVFELQSRCMWPMCGG